MHKRSCLKALVGQLPCKSYNQVFCCYNPTKEMQFSCVPTFIQSKWKANHKKNYQQSLSFEMYNLSHVEGHQEDLPVDHQVFFVDTVDTTWTIEVWKDFGCMYTFVMRSGSWGWSGFVTSIEKLHESFLFLVARFHRIISKETIEPKSLRD